MSHQGEDGWFPECLVYGMGNIHGAVCLDPTCHEGHEGILLDDKSDKYVEAAGHAWQLCQSCDRKILSDGGAFGVYTLRVDCWNAYGRAARLPPSCPAVLHDHLSSGVLRLELDERGPVRSRDVIVRKAGDS